MAFPVFDTKEQIPAGFEGEYEEKDGKWVAKAVTPDPALGEAGKRALDAERTRAETAEREAKAEKKRADDLQRTADAKAKGISEQELQAIRDAEALARKPLEEERDRLAAENRKLKLTDRVKAMALAAGVMPDRIEDAMLALERRTDLTSDGDSIVVKDAAGTVVAGANVAEFLSKEFKTEKPWLFSGTGSSGGGSGGSGGGAGGDSYDPVAAGNAAAAEQKKGIAENELAFR